MRAKKIKILIACDKETNVERLYYDFSRAGLPKNVEASVLSVADVIVPPGTSFAGVPVPKNTLTWYKAVKRQIKQEIEKARDKAVQTRRDLRKKFPHWKFKAESMGDSPAWGIIRKAEEWGAGLLVVGSHNVTRVGKFFLGSVAQKVLTDAQCSVRIVRNGVKEIDSPVRMIIGLDGSADSERAVEAVARRSWKKGSSVHLVTVVDTALSSAVISRPSATRKWIQKKDKSDRAWIQRMIEGSKAKLEKAGLFVSSLIREGDPKSILVEESSRWGADCIFLGARGLNGVERFLIGSVSTAVATGAHCSVEVVRKTNREK